MSSPRTKVALLGTGNPNPDPSRAGSGVLILVDGKPYIVDFGAGIVRQIAALTAEYAGPLKVLDIADLSIAFLTHMHSDHTIGLPDLLLTPWIMGREQPLEIFGPDGIFEMSQHILQAYQDDIKYRLYGSEPALENGWRLNAHEMQEGLVYKDKRVKVEAFPVKHGTWPNAYGFRFTTPEKVIVISGDTAPCDNILKYGKGADILIHEVYYEGQFEQKEEVWQSYHRSHHTSTFELAEIARKTKPEVLILYHTLFWEGTEEDILEEIFQSYDGKVVLGADLQVFE